MVKYGLILIFGILLFSEFSAKGQPDNCVKSTEGKEFWFGFMENRNYQVPQFPTYLSVVHYAEITLISNYQCKVDIFIGKSLTPAYSETVYPNIPLPVKIPWNDVEAMGSEIVENKAIHLISDNPLNLYAFNWCEKSSDIAVIFPKESIGKEYYTMCYKPNIDSYTDIFGYEHYRSGRNSEFLVVATEDSTNVVITPSKVTDKQHPANMPFSIKLSKGELYQVQSLNFENLPGQGDLTGSHILSDKPISVFSGSLATTVPAEENVDAWDHLYEQMPPLQSWGRKFVTVPLKGRSKDVFRVLASQNNTSVRIGKKDPVVLNQGGFHEFELNENEPTLIDSDRPVLLAQFMISNSVDRPSDRNQYNWDGDPFMVIISPVEQTRELVTFVAYNSQEVKDKYYVNVATKDSSTSRILLDNNPISFAPLANSGYSFAQVKIEKGTHNLKSTEPGNGFIAYVYGYGGVESYGYGVGFNLSTQLDLGGDIHFVRDTIVLCPGENKILDAGSHFSSFLWNTGETTQKINVSKKGYYEVTASTYDGCVLSDGIHVIESKSVVTLGNDSAICNPGSLLLDAGNFSSYIWSTQDTARTISAKTPGQYSVVVRDKYGCSAADTMEVRFTDKPKLTVNRLDTLICGSKTMTVDITADKGSYTLLSSDPRVKVEGVTATIPDYGTYMFTFIAKDQYSCSSDTSFTIRFRKSSAVDILIDSTCSGFSLDASYQGEAVPDKTNFTWLFAKDTIADGISRNRISMQLGGGLSGELSLLVTEEGCQTQKVTRQIDEVPDLNFTPSDTVVCLSGEIAFIAASTKNVIDYEWDWGDGVVEHLPGNAVHTYAKEGFYDVRLTARTDNNCINTIRKERVLHVAPVPSVGFSIVDNQCLEPGIQELSYIGSANTGDRFLWDLSSFLSGEVIQNPGESKGPLRYDLTSQPAASVKLQVISKLGCESEMKSVLLKRKPSFNLLTGESKGCAPFHVEVVAKPGDAIDQIDFKWSFGDGMTENGNNLSHTYTFPDQKYDLMLIAVSATTGCIDTLSKAGFITVYPKPEASFSMDEDVLLIENPTVTFRNESQGADRFLWSFGDGTTSVEKDPVHQYMVVGYRNVLLKAINDLGCTDTISRKVSIALVKLHTPNAFSPNAVNEIDREFRLYANGVMEKGYHLKIMSRWNDIVFECKNEIRGWNGQLSNGRMAPPGNYIWILKFTDFLGKGHRQMGTVTVAY